MVFTSLDYALLLLATVVVYWWVPARAAGAVLLAASVVFYAFWSVPFLALVALSVAIGFGSGRWIELARDGRKPGGARLPVAFAVLSLLGLLGGFKYADRLWQLGAFLGAAPNTPAIVLPLAISFYTFQILGYVVDVYRGATAERSLLRFSLFVGFFPQLIAGPIARAHQLLPQLVRRVAFDGRRALLGIELLAYGVVKKTVFADNLAVYVDAVYADPAAAGGLDVVLATLAFGGQIYCDFSGYTDIARGSARILGIELPENFRSPYAASSLAEFWRRWHVTLSTWLRDYLYIPLGGSRRGPSRTQCNLLITMALGGLWHGAGLTFVLWGVYHGVLLAAERVIAAPRPSASPRGIGRPTLGMLVTFVLVQLGWALFRAENLETLGALARSLYAAPFALQPSLDGLAFLPLIVATYALHAASAVLRGRDVGAESLLRVELAAPALVLASLLVVVFGGSSDAFIYFRF